MSGLLISRQDAGTAQGGGDRLEPLLASAAIAQELAVPSSQAPRFQGPATAPATEAAPLEPYPVATTPLTDPTVVLLLVVLVFPLLIMAMLALRPETGFRTWFATSLWDFRGLFSGIVDRRRQIHDKPYLERVLEAERQHEESRRRRNRRSKRGSGPDRARSAQHSAPSSDLPNPPDHNSPQP